MLAAPPGASLVPAARCQAQVSVRHFGTGRWTTPRHGLEAVLILRSVPLGLARAPCSRVRSCLTREQRKSSLPMETRPCRPHGHPDLAASALATRRPGSASQRSRRCLRSRPCGHRCDGGRRPSASGHVRPRGRSEDLIKPPSSAVPPNSIYEAWPPSFDPGGANDHSEVAGRPAGGGPIREASVMPYCGQCRPGTGAACRKCLAGKGATLSLRTEPNNRVPHVSRPGCC